MAPPLMTEVKLETAATATSLLEELRKRTALETTSERMPALLGHGVIWVLAIVKSLTKL